MKLISRHYLGIGIAIAIVILNFLFLKEVKIFYFIFGIAAIIAILPFLITLLIETGREKEKEDMFLEFTRSLVESVKAGTPISKSIINIKGKDFGSLTPHISKLANQISLGIPIRQAFAIFAKETNNKVIERSVNLISESEQSGGQIDIILESIAKSVSQIEDLKKERKTEMFNFILEGYIIFFVFLVIMLVMDIKFIPMVMGTIGEAAGGGGFAGLPIGLGVAGISQETISNIFLGLIIIQGFFTGLIIGKLSEGYIKYGIKHSIILAIVSYLITFGARAFV